MLRDLGLGLIGISCIFLQNILRGSLRHWHAFLGTYVIGALHGATPVAIRSRLSKLVTNDEVSTLFGLMSMFEALCPIVGTVLFTTVFDASIDTYPGLVFQIAAFLLIIPFLIFAWIDLFCDQH